jgi:hypothetical protein
MVPVRLRVAIALVGLVALVVGVGGAWLARARWFQHPPVTEAAKAAPAAESARREDAEPQSICPAEQGSRSIRYGPFQVVVERDDQDVCKFEVRTASGEHLADDDTALAIDAQYVDLDRDGVPELLLVSDSGGSGAHANSYIFTAKPQPRLVMQYDGCATGVRDAGNGGRVLQTCHLGFNMMDGICNGCSPRPRIFYALENGALRNRSARFAAEYDKSIGFEEEELKGLDVAAFVASTADDDPAYVDSDVRWRVMRILADYIYSDRDTEAIEVAGKLWPAWDRGRILGALQGHAPQ